MESIIFYHNLIFALRCLRLMVRSFSFPICKIHFAQLSPQSEALKTLPDWSNARRISVFTPPEIIPIVANANIVYNYL